MTKMVQSIFVSFGLSLLCFVRGDAGALIGCHICGPN
jgi:hypothetical protein